MSEVKIREARPGDAKPVLDLLPALGYQVPDGASSRYFDVFANAVAHPEVTVYVAVDGLAILGFVSLALHHQIRLGGRTASIDELVVHPDRRGQGLGRRLLDAALERARQMRCLRVEVHTNRQRDSYRRGFYAARGFVEADSALLRLTL
ncbi:MAG TPA: GNAT family N-acetyltransferase [Myxococcota bacterium]|jgi:GNAT superfamily N-acetyltransferase|nr:GNAT family N-acetyltransferase [Myxococcota bacterium]